MKAQDIETLFNAVLDRSPLGKYKQALLDIADAKSKVTRFSEDEILAADTVLARYSNLGDKLPEVSKLTLDFATFMGVDATTAALQLGKAFEDIGGGSLTLLGRTRLLTKEQVDQAKAMALGGDAAGAQSYIMDILGQKVGGLAETMGGTFQGKLTIFQNTLSHMAEVMGGPLLDALQPLMDNLLTLAQQVAPQVAAIFKDKVVPAISAFVQWFLSPETIGSISKFISFITDKIIPGIAQFVTWLSNLNGSNLIPQPLMTFFQSMSTWWTVNGPGITESGKKMFDALVKGIGDISEKIGPFVTQVLAKLATWFADNGPAIQTVIGTIATVFSVVLVPAITDAVGIILPIIQGVIDLITNLATVVLDLLTGNWKKAWEDLKKTAQTLVPDILAILKPIQDFFENLSDNLRKVLGLKGPGQMWTPYGTPGMASGGPVSAGSPYTVGENGPEMFVPATNGTIIPNGAGGSGVTLNVNIMGGFTDPQMAARQLRPALMYVLRDLGVA